VTSDCAGKILNTLENSTFITYHCVQCRIPRRHALRGNEFDLFVPKIARSVPNFSNIKRSNNLSLHHITPLRPPHGALIIVPAQKDSVVPVDKCVSLISYIYLHTGYGQQTWVSSLATQADIYRPYTGQEHNNRS